MPRQRSHDHRGSEHRRAEQQEIDCIYSSPPDSNAKTGCVACSAQSAVSHSWLQSVAKGLVAAYLNHAGGAVSFTTKSALGLTIGLSERQFHERRLPMKQPIRILGICLLMLAANLVAQAQGPNSPPLVVRFSGTDTFSFFNDCTGET